MKLKEIILRETNFFYSKDHTCRLLIPKIIVKIKNLLTTFKMETLLPNGYTCLDQKSKLFKTNSIAIEEKRTKIKYIVFKIKRDKHIH